MTNLWESVVILEERKREGRKEQKKKERKLSVNTPSAGVPLEVSVTHL